MTVIEAKSAGGPEVLRPGKRALPDCAGHEVLVKVIAAGVNGPDLMQRRGLYPAPKDASDLLGLEISGTIAECGANVTQFKRGDEICALTNGGGYAEYCAVNADHCLPVPPNMTVTDAAGLPETYFTVWSNIFMTAGLCTDETLLVHGGAGGIGTTAIQLAKAFGARVIATDSPHERCQICKDLGADLVIDYKTEDFVEVVRAEGGADVILDIVGGPYIERNIKAAAPDGRIVQLAFALGSKVEINLMPVMLKRLKYMGSTLRTRPTDFKTTVKEELLTKVWPKFALGELKTVTSITLPMKEAARAHEIMERATHTGKILLQT